MEKGGKIAIGIVSGVAGISILVAVLLGMSKCSVDKPTSSSDSETSISSSSESSISSEPTSSEPESSSEPSSSSESPGHDHVLGDWLYDEDDHWKECSICHEVFDLNEHNFGKETRTKNLDDFTKVDIVKTCSICEYEHKEVVNATKQELCDFMNEDLSIHEEPFNDVFGAKDYLQDLGYPVNEDLPNGEHFGYDKDTKKIAIVDSSNKVTYPESEKGKEVIVYKEEGVVNEAELKDALRSISKSCSGIKVKNDFTIFNSIEIDIDEPVEIDLNGKTLTVVDGSGYSAFTIRNDESEITIKNGTIKTAPSTSFHNGAACIASYSCKSLRVSNCNLISQSQRGYAYIDDVNTNEDYKVFIEDSTLTSDICSVCVQKSNCTITNSTLNGAVSINGGNTVIDDCVINPTSASIDVSEGFVTSLSITENILQAMAEDLETFDRKIFTSTDAITILDRRSTKGTYGEISLTVKNSTLNSYKVSNEVYGYGLRYIDLWNDLSLPSSSGNIKIENCTFPCCSSGEPSEKPGGYSFFSLSK